MEHRPTMKQEPFTALTESIGKASASIWWRARDAYWSSFNHGVSAGTCQESDAHKAWEQRWNCRSCFDYEWEDWSEWNKSLSTLCLKWFDWKYNSFVYNNYNNYFVHALILLIFYLLPLSSKKKKRKKRGANTHSSQLFTSLTMHCRSAPIGWYPTFRCSDAGAHLTATSSPLAVLTNVAAHMSSSSSQAKTTSTTTGAGLHPSPSRGQVRATLGWVSWLTQVCQGQGYHQSCGRRS